MRTDAVCAGRRSEATNGGISAVSVLEGMMDKPSKCCALGTYECAVPMPIKRRIEYIDFCIADIVASLNAANIKTEASCCGHGDTLGTVILEDGRWLVIAEDRAGFQMIADALAKAGHPMGRK